MAGEEICQGVRCLYLITKLSRSRLSVGVCCQGSRVLLSSEICQGTARGQLKERPAFLLTARQYGEVVLPDEASGQGPGTLATKLSRCKEGMARVFAIMVLNLVAITSVAVQTFLGVGLLSPYSYFVNSTGVVSRYTPGRNLETVPMQDLNCV